MLEPAKMWCMHTHRWRLLLLIVVVKRLGFGSVHVDAAPNAPGTHRTASACDMGSIRHAMPRCTLLIAGHPHSSPIAPPPPTPPCCTMWRVGG